MITREEQIKELEALITEYELDDAGDGFNFMKRIPRAERHLELLRMDVKVEETDTGFLVNDKFIIAAQENKWRIPGKGKWYVFKDIRNFVEGHVFRRK